MSWNPNVPPYIPPSTWPIQPPTTVWYPQPQVIYYVDQKTKALIREIRDLLKEVLKEKKESEK